MNSFVANSTIFPGMTEKKTKKILREGRLSLKTVRKMKKEATAYNECVRSNYLVLVGKKHKQVEKISLPEGYDHKSDHLNDYVVHYSQNVSTKKQKAAEQVGISVKYRVFVSRKDGCPPVYQDLLHQYQQSF